MPKKPYFFPSKGIAKKTLHFLANVPRIQPEKRLSAIRRFLRGKKPAERAKFMEYARALQRRNLLFEKVEQITRLHSQSNPKFKGIIIFGGTVKKTTPITDLDIIMVGELSHEEEKQIVRELQRTLGIEVNAFQTLNLEADPQQFEKLLSIKYLSYPKEWTVQNFIGSKEYRRKVMKAFDKAVKVIAEKKRKESRLQQSCQQTG